jgi:hypothetical protein
MTRGDDSLSLYSTVLGTVCTVLYLSILMQRIEKRGKNDQRENALQLPFCLLGSFSSWYESKLSTHVLVHLVEWKLSSSRLFFLFFVSTKKQVKQ